MTLIKKRIRVWVIIAVTSLLLSLGLLMVSNDLLSIQHPIPTNHFLFEAWLGPVDFEEGIQLLKSKDDPEVYVVGQTYEEVPFHKIRKDKMMIIQQGVVLLTNACLIIQPELLNPFKKADTTEIIVRARGGSADGIFAHFNLVVNGSINSSFFSTNELQDYSTIVNLHHGLQTISLYYDNDYAKVSEGRYLIVHSILINGQEYLLDSTNAVYTLSAPRNFTGFSSQASWARRYMSELGVDSNLVSIVEFKKSNINQTLEGARTFAAWSKGKNIGSLNIISEKLHSRRSWMTYKKVMGRETKVGIQYFSREEAEKRPPQNWWDPSMRIVDELSSFVGNWFYLTFIYESE